MRWLITIFFFLVLHQAVAQGVAVSYLIPTNGELGTPVSPLSIRGLSLKLNDNLRIETGFSVYNLPGLAISGVPFSENKPIRGHHFGLLLPLSFVPSIDFKSFSISIGGGGFLLFHSNTRLNHENLNRALAAWEQWDIADNQLKIENRMGLGLMGGINIEIPVNRSMSINFGLNYLSGRSEAPLSGNYAGGNIGGAITQKSLELNDTFTRLQGFEILFGVNMIR